MPDISMCKGDPRGLKCHTCYRKLAAPNPHRQAYFQAPPLLPDGNCEHYWDNDVRSDVKKPARQKDVD